MAEAREAGVVEPTASTGLERIPEMIGRYRVTGYLGRGGMGMVLSAQDTELKRPVALKLLHHGAWGDKASSRIEREAQAMAKLSHPNVVTVYEVGRSGDQPFIAMELVDGVTLREWLRGEKRSWRKTLAMIVAAGRGLAAAHEAGLVHRDFKPENVLVGVDGRPRVSDFGLVASTILEGETGAGHEGASLVAGTPAYMAPEQWGARDIDTRADQYAFAVTCWEALCGRRPFASKNPRDAALPHSPRESDKLRSRRGVPRRVEVALRRALQAEREKRWPKLSELLDHLERLGRDRRPAMVAAALVPVAAVAMVAFRAGGGAAESPCRTAAAAVNDVWSSARQSQLRETYAGRTEPSAKRVWPATERTLQEWVDEHRAMRIETCELARTGGTDVKRIAEARTNCLDQTLGRFAALVTVLEEPDAKTISYARSAALGLPNSSGCRSATPAEPVTTTGPAPSHETISEAHGELARSFALRTTGKPREAVAIAEPVAKRADELGWQPLVASAYLELGIGYLVVRDSKNADEALQRAILFADASRDDDVRFRATIALAENAMMRSSYDDAGRAIEMARMIARRLPDDVDREILIAQHGAHLNYWRGQFAECVARSEELVEMVDKTKAKSRYAAELRLDLARCLQAMGRTSEYGAPLREVLAIMEETSGRDHPFAADALMGLGAIARTEKRPEEALGYLQEALAIRERAFGPENPEVAALLNNIGNVFKDLGRTDEARQSIERALAIWEKAWGPDSPAVGVASSNLGRMAMKRGDLVAAEAYFRRTLEIRRKKRPAGHPELAAAQVRLGELLLAKRDRACLPLLREAVAAYKTNEARAEPRDEGSYMLGRALFELGVDRVEGRKLMEAACKAYDTANDPFECRAYLTKLSAR